MKRSKKTVEDKDSGENIEYKPDDKNEQKRTKEKKGKKKNTFWEKLKKTNKEDAEINLDDENEQSGNENKKTKKTSWWKKKKEENIKKDADDQNEQNENKTKKKKKIFQWLNKNSTEDITRDIKMNKITKNKKSHGIKTLWSSHVIEEHDGQIEEQKTLLDETKELIVLVQEIYNNDSTEERREEVKSQYMELEERVFKVIEDSSFNKIEENLLKQAIQALEEEGRKDIGPAWPPWKSKWRERVASSVEKKVKSLPKYSESFRGSRLSKLLTTLGKAMKKDITHAIENLKPHYPEDYDVCNTYAQQYHQHLQYEINRFTEDNLKINDIHCLLNWINVLYPKILKDPALIDHIDVDQLGELLPAEKICHLENTYKCCQQGYMKKWMTNALDQEEKRWKKGKHSELSINIIRMYVETIEAAKGISENLVQNVTRDLEKEFLKFLKRYQQSFKNYHENKEAKPHYEEIIIANMNCCNHFRDFIANRVTDEGAKKKMYSALGNIENKGTSVLLQDLFQDIESHFREISQTNGENSQDKMLQVIETANTYRSSVTTLQPQCHQVLIGKIHMHLVQEYISAITHIRQCNVEEQTALATKMQNTANLLMQFCTDHLNDAQKSEATCVNDAILRIAKIIELQDLEAIKTEAGVLTGTYPDIRKDHVKSILRIKKNLTICERSSVLRTLESNEREDPPDQQRFTFEPYLPCYYKILHLWPPALCCC